MNHKRHNKIDNDRKNILISFYKAFKAFGTALPVLFVVILVLGLFRSFLSSRMLAAVFTGKLFQDTVIGSLIGSISGGNAVTSYRAIKIPLLPLMVHYFGIPFFVVLTGYMIIASIAEGHIVEMTEGRFSNQM
jgi:hypothetical protein